MSSTVNVHQPHHIQERGYIPIADHALIGNLRTAALVSLDGSIESYCIPDFDSPSVFARILDANKGGHFSLTPTTPFTTKQAYLPSSNVLQTKFMNTRGVVAVTDFLPRTDPILFWLVRRVEVIRGSLPLALTCAPAFNYARDAHTTQLVPDLSSPAPGHLKALFRSPALDLDLRYVAESLADGIPEPAVHFELLDLSEKGHKGPAVAATLDLVEGQAVTFILRVPPEEGASMAARPSVEKAQELGVSLPSLIESASHLRAPDDPMLTKTLVHRLLDATNTYWSTWIRRSTYTGAWKEAVHRSALALKMLIYEPTAYMEFIFDRIKDKNPDGSLQIMYTIHGGKLFPEEELMHLDGHKGSRPVRIGNGAIDHVQLDIYGELMDSVYLSQKFGKPLSYDTWVGVRELVDYVVANYHRPDLSIWEVRNRMRHFTYSKIMMWVAIDRGLRLADKRSLPCPHRLAWLTARDDLYEQIMARAWNPERQFFAQSYEDTDVLDSAVLIMPLVFFSPASDPRFVSTLRQILKTPERGGLTSNNLVYRYDVSKTDDGVGGEEGTFCLCTLWCIEALTRAGEYDKSMLERAVAMFEDFIQYTNHVGLCTEEISAAGEALGNAVQGFTHVTLISAAFNLSRTQSKASRGLLGMGN
ncbi:glycoside hydrolase family 15 protein [Neolentinus lepideus HHB14362 ss-1]|uniref:Glycoside hydrolase family 15 protein n=1 Tax=Neolentinus lepideus HHB14362 ss-1 TaxID=1314782 RepID=A0A165QTM2_9AGAM|nr:glycoside hydrolase family 15 protein [Neolentinus lepideus HHB14362 ss-1]